MLLLDLSACWQWQGQVSECEPHTGRIHFLPELTSVLPLRRDRASSVCRFPVFAHRIKNYSNKIFLNHGHKLLLPCSPQLKSTKTNQGEVFVESLWRSGTLQPSLQYEAKKYHTVHTLWSRRCWVDRTRWGAKKSISQKFIRWTTDHFRLRRMVANTFLPHTN